MWKLNIQQDWQRDWQTDYYIDKQTFQHWRTKQRTSRDRDWNRFWNQFCDRWLVPVSIIFGPKDWFWSRSRICWVGSWEQIWKGWKSLSCCIGQIIFVWFVWSDQTKGHPHVTYRSHGSCSLTFSSDGLECTEPLLLLPKGVNIWFVAVRGFVFVAI